MSDEEYSTPIISMEVSGGGDFTYSPSVKRLNRGEAVTWNCAQGPFSISFKEGTPFDQHDYHSEPCGDEWSVTTCGVPDGGPTGHFHYAVAIYSVDRKRVFLDAACPEIIVN